MSEKLNENWLSNWITNFQNSEKKKLWIMIGIYIILIYLTLPLMRIVVNTLKDFLGLEIYKIFVDVVLFSAGITAIFLTVRKGWNTFLYMLIPIGILGVISLFVSIPDEKIHFVQYGLLGALVVLALPDLSWLNLLFAFFFVSLVGTIDEGIQWLLPNRFGDWRDVSFNIIGGIFGLWIGKIYSSSSYSSSG